MRIRNKKVLRYLRKIASDEEVVTSAGRLFQTREAAMTNVRSPILALLMADRISAAVEEERRRRRDSRSANVKLEQGTKEPCHANSDKLERRVWIRCAQEH